MLFFISLSLYAMKNQPEAVRQFTQNSAATANVQLTFGVEVIGEMIIVIGLVMGGLFAANSLGITFASTAYGAAKGVGKGFGGWVGRKGIRTAGWGFAGPSQRTQQWAQQGGIKGALGRADIAIRGRLNKIPVLKNLGQQYRKKGEHKNLFASVLGGMKKGSGLFKKEKQKFKLPSGETIELEPAEEKPLEKKKTA